VDVHLRWVRKSLCPCMRRGETKMDRIFFLAHHFFVKNFTSKRAWKYLDLGLSEDSCVRVGFRWIFFYIWFSCPFFLLSFLTIATRTSHISVFFSSFFFGRRFAVIRHEPRCRSLVVLDERSLPLLKPLSLGATCSFPFFFLVLVLSLLERILGCLERPESGSQTATLL